MSDGPVEEFWLATLAPLAELEFPWHVPKGMGGKGGKKKKSKEKLKEVT